MSKVIARFPPEIVESAQENSFVPLVERTGLLVNDVMREHRDREIVVWGAGVLGRCLMHQTARYAVSEQALYFADSNPKLVGTMVDGHVVLDVNDASLRAQEQSAFLLIALAEHTTAAMAQLGAAGLVAGADYLSYRKLSRPEAVIQVSSHEDGRLINMTPDHYRKIIAKLKKDIPDLFQIDLAGWGDPLDNPYLAEIIEASLPFAPCTVTTQLNASLPTIERVLFAVPTQFVVDVRGDEACDAAFAERLNALADHQRRGGKIEIRVKYTRFQNNCHGAESMRILCKELGIKMVQTIGYIDPYDTTLQLCETDDLNTEDASNLAWPLHEALTLALIDRGCPCLCQRIFPVIRVDGSVGLCHLYLHPSVHTNYLVIDYQALLARRFASPHCRRCQHYGLHRLDVDVLQDRHAIPLIRHLGAAHA